MVPVRASLPGETGQHGTDFLAGAYVQEWHTLTVYNCVV